MKDFYPEITQLNEYQRAAVLSEQRALMVNACVGSGKTTVLTAKVRYLHEEKHIPYEDMAVLTFTNKAADEIRMRLGLAVRKAEALENPASESAPEDQLLFGTFHSVARKLLSDSPAIKNFGRTENFTILEPEEELALAEALITAHKLKIKYKNRLRKRMETEREQCLSEGSSKYKDDLPRLFPLLEEEKRKSDQMTFTDLLDLGTELLKEHPFYPKWIIVDEVQDCNKKQLEFLKLLYGPETSFFAVGDPNQMIYSFRGSQDTLFYQLKYEFEAEEITLPINYRSKAAILTVANRFRQFGTKIDSQSPSSSAEDIKIPVHQYYDPFQEAEVLSQRIEALIKEGTPAEEIAVLYRLKEQGDKFDKIFERKGMEGVRHMTAHASKGLEFDIVFVIGLNQGLFPLNQKSEGGFEEEQRLFFVAITRARKQLELSWCTCPDQVRAIGMPSPFLERLPEEVCVRNDRRSDKEKRENLQKLRQEVREEIRNKEQADQKEAPEGLEENPPKIRVTHPRYGEGILIREDENTWQAEFPGYGTKEFIKMFEPIRKLC